MKSDVEKLQVKICNNEYINGFGNETTKPGHLSKANNNIKKDVVRLTDV